MGLCIVKPEHRGQGHGRVLSEARLAHIENRSCGIEADPDKQALFEKIGFKLCHSTSRFQLKRQSNRQYGLSPKLFDLRARPIESIIAYEKPYFFADRTWFLSEWIHQPQALALGYLQDQNLQGIAVMRPAIQGFKIGPFYANTQEVATTLLKGLMANSKGEVVHLGYASFQYKRL